MQPGCTKPQLLVVLQDGDCLNLRPEKHQRLVGLGKPRENQRCELSVLMVNTLVKKCQKYSKVSC